jgi:hypothetical protein
MPSSIDSFGYAALEAMAASLPVVAIANAAVPELVAGRRDRHSRLLPATTRHSPARSRASRARERRAASSATPAAAASWSGSTRARRRPR